MYTNNGMLKPIITLEVNGSKTVIPITKKVVAVLVVAALVFVFTLACVVGSLTASSATGAESGQTGKTYTEVRCQDVDYAFTHSKCERYNR